MLRAVIKKEMLEHLVSFRFIVSTLTLLILSLLAAFVGTQDFELRESSYQDRRVQQEKDLAEVHVYSHLEPEVNRAPEPLSVFDRGLDARLGITVELDVFEIPARASGRYRGDELMAPARELDLTTIIRLIGGLMALLLTFDAVSGERERGTLRLIFANGISRPTLFFGKWVGAILALVIPLAASVGASVWVLLARSDVTLGIERWLRLASLVGAYAIYLCVMLLIGLLLSIVTRTPSASLVYCLLSWLAIVFLIPQSAVVVASTSGGVVAAQRAAASEIHELERQRDQRLVNMENQQINDVTTVFERSPVLFIEGRKVLLRYGTEEYYAARARFHQAEVEVGLEFADQIFALERRALDVRRNFERRVKILSLPSPAFLLEQLSESLAGTSVADHDAFLEGSRAYRGVFLDYLNRHQAFSSWRWFTDDAPESLLPWTTLAGYPPEALAAAEEDEMIDSFQSVEVQQLVQGNKEKWAHDPDRLLRLDDLPRPQMATLGLAEALGRVSAELCVLLLANGLLVVVGLRRFGHYPLS